MPLTAIVLLLFLLFGQGGSDSGDAESRLRSYLHTAQGQVACSYLAMGAVLTPTANADLSPDRILAIMEEECR